MLFILGLGLFVVGTLWMLVLAFRASTWWGLGCLFIPSCSFFICSRIGKKQEIQLGFKSWGWE
jgi:hypothetical protein